MSLSYAREKLTDAVSILNKKRGDLKDRLERACFELALVSEDDIPSTATTIYTSIINRLSAVEPVGDEGLFRAAIEAMSTDEAQRLANDIKSLAALIPRR